MGESDWRPFIYGGLASITAEFGTFPIDTTKTRLQIQGQKLDARHIELKYSGMTDAFMQISRQEGIKALYSGAVEQLQRKRERFCVGNVGCAVIAGAFSSAIANPTDVLKVRMQVHGKGSHQNLARCFHEVYVNEGIKGLWRGVGPTTQRAAVIAAVELPVYDYCKQQFLSVLGDSIVNHFVSSFIASLGSAIASTPLDVIRTRLMNQRRLKRISGIIPGELLYKGTVDCALQAIRNEGFSSLYKGFIPAWLRMGPWNIIFFITYEQMKKIY